MAEIADLINQLMRANFVTTDAVLDKQLASLPWADRIRPKTDDEANGTPSPREISGWAQRAFLLLCDLFNLKDQSNNDESAVEQASIYIDMLDKNVSTMPCFLKSYMDPLAEESYTNAVRALDNRQWFNIKNKLITCCNLIYDMRPSVQQNTTEKMSGKWGDADFTYSY